MSTLYPVAETAEQALYQPRGFAAREREAQALAGGEVTFTTELVGPAFATRDMALEAYRSRVAVEAPPDARWGDLTPVYPPLARGASPPAPLQPSFRGGRRWPEPAGEPATLWRLAVSYWRIGTEEGVGELAAARKLRRGGGEGLNGDALNALARQPLRAVKPQQPLDIGLFEARRPEAPDVIVPDE
jgi:hypothetical protein